MRFTRFLAAVLVTSCLFWLGGILADRRSLNEYAIFLEVFGDTKGSIDDRLDITVKKAIFSCIKGNDLEAGEGHNLNMCSSALRRTLRDKLRGIGMVSKVDISFSEEIFDAKKYGEFFLPTGRYKVVRIFLGDGKECLSREIFFCRDTKENPEAILEGHLMEAVCLRENRYVRLIILEYLGRMEKVVRGNG